MISPTFQFHTVFLSLISRRLNQLKVAAQLPNHFLAQPLAAQRLILLE
jgi:hypothetical protein